jgi:hypothetical protein
MVAQKKVPAQAKTATAKTSTAKTATAKTATAKTATAKTATAKTATAKTATAKTATAKTATAKTATAKTATAKTATAKNAPKSQPASLTTNSTSGSQGSLKRQARKVGTDIISPVSRDNQKQIFSWDKMHNVDAGVAFELVYGFKANVKIDSEYGLINKLFARDWWERTSPTGQCGNVIGPFVPDVTVCYICDIPIQSNAECEHILPVFSAAMYLTLYRNDYKVITDKVKKGISLNPDEQKIYNELKLEYAWAHRCCNQKKSNINFLTYTSDRGKSETGAFKLDYNTTFKVLESIVSSSVKGESGKCTEENLKTFFKSMTKKKIVEWINQRIDYLNAEEGKEKGKGKIIPLGKVRSIVEYLNNNKTNNYSMFMLSNLASLISAADMIDIHSTWQQINGTIQFKETPPAEQITKAISMANACNKINAALQFSWGRTLEIKQIVILYKRISFIPDDINISLSVSRNNTKSKTIYPAVLGSLLNLNKINDNVNDFFRNFYAVITEPTINLNKKLINTEKSGGYACKMVGICFEILFIQNGIHVIKDFIRENSNPINPTLMEFSTKFNNVFEESITYLLNVLIEYSDYTRRYEDVDNSFILYFLKIFSYFVNGVDTTATPIIMDKIEELWGKDETRYNKYLSEENKKILFDKAQINNYDIINDYISNIENAVVKYYMETAEYLKLVPSWDADVPEPGDTQFTTDAKGIAIGASALIQMRTDPTAEDYKFDLDEIGQAIGNGILIKDINLLCNEYGEICNEFINSNYPSQNIDQLEDNQLTELLLQLDKRVSIYNINQMCSDYDSTFCIEIIKNYMITQYKDKYTEEMEVKNILEQFDNKDLINIISEINGIKNINTPAPPTSVTTSDATTADATTADATTDATTDATSASCVGPECQMDVSGGMGGKRNTNKRNTNKRNTNKRKTNKRKTNKKL